MITSTAVNENVSNSSFPRDDAGREQGDEEAMLRLGGGGGCRSDCIIFERVSETLKVGVIVVVMVIMIKIATTVELAEAVQVVACSTQLTAIF